MTRRVLLIILSAQVALSAGLLWNYFASSQPGTVPTKIPIEGGQPLTIESAIAASAPVAQSWKPDAVLFSASMQLVWPDTAGASQARDGGWILLTYRSGRETLSLLIERTRGLILNRSYEQWPQSPRKTLSLSGVKIDSSLVVFASDLAGGDDFRNACPSYHTVSRISLSERSGEPVWVVTYDDSRQLGNPLWQMVTRAATGNVMEVQDWSSFGPAC